MKKQRRTRQEDINTAHLRITLESVTSRSYIESSNNGSNERNPNPRYPNQCKYQSVGNMLLLHYMFVPIAHIRIGDLLKFHGNRALKEIRWWSERAIKCSKCTMQRNTHLQTQKDRQDLFAGLRKETRLHVEMAVSL
jgi:hypothetical protein